MPRLEKVNIEPAFGSIGVFGNAAGDCGVVGVSHVQVVADVGVVLVFSGIAVAAFHKLLFVPHHVEVSVYDFFFGVSPFQIDVWTGILCGFAAVAEVSVCLVGFEVRSGFFIGAGLLGLGGKRQRLQILGGAVLVDDVEAVGAPAGVFGTAGRGC